MGRKIENITKPGAIVDRLAHTPGFYVLADERSFLFLHFTPP
jgi:hypothetical protein